MPLDLKSHQSGNAFNTLILLMATVGMLVFSYVWFLLGQLTNSGIYNSMLSISPNIDFHIAFAFVTIFGITALFHYYFLENLAAAVLKAPCLELDENGIFRLGLGIRRDLFLSWNNIKRVKVFEAGNSLVRIWIEDPTKAWKSRNPIYSFLNTLIFLASFGRLRTKLDQPFIQFTAAELNLDIRTLNQILTEKIDHASDPSWRQTAGWEDQVRKKLPKYVNLVYLLPLVCLWIGMQFSIARPHTSVAEVTVATDYRFDGQMLMIVGLAFFGCSMIAGMWSVLKRLFLKKPAEKGRTIAILVFFVMGITALYYGWKLYRPHYVAERGFSSYEELRNARKQGFTTGEEWRNHLTDEKSENQESNRVTRLFIY